MLPFKIREQEKRVQTKKTYIVYFVLPRQLHLVVFLISSCGFGLLSTVISLYFNKLSGDRVFPRSKLRSNTDESCEWGFSREMPEYKIVTILWEIRLLRKLHNNSSPSSFCQSSGLLIYHMVSLLVSRLWWNSDEGSGNKASSEAIKLAVLIKIQPSFLKLCSLDYCKPSV